MAHFWFLPRLGVPAHPQEASLVPLLAPIPPFSICFSAESQAGGPMSAQHPGGSQASSTPINEINPHGCDAPSSANWMHMDVGVKKGHFLVSFRWLSDVSLRQSPWRAWGTQVAGPH